MGKSRRRNIDISTPGARPGLGFRANLVIWGTITLLGVILYTLTEVMRLPVWWAMVALPILALLGLAGWIGWNVIIKRGVFTWRRLAMAPIKLRAQGDEAGAEAAFAKAIARANRFTADAHPRGLMLCELAMYIKNQGRYAEAIAMYEESAGILAQHLVRNPLDYFIVLNNYAICYVHLRDFENAQHMLEKALDLILAARKHDANRPTMLPLAQVHWLEFVLHLNLAFLFLEMHELDEADGQLREAEELMPLLSQRGQAQWHDHYVGLSAYWEFESGNIGRAEKELANAKNPDYPACLRLRAKMAVARKEFALGEELLRKFHDDERKKGPLHRPEHYKVALELAECQYGQGKHEEALMSLQEARSLVADFKLPTDAKWRQAMQTWLQRAQALGKPELQAELEAAVQTPPARDQTITILDRFRKAQ